jgi:ABC-type microcin C transport system permease subunit YejE
MAFSRHFVRWPKGFRLSLALGFDTFTVFDCVVTTSRCIIFISLSDFWFCVFSFSCVYVYLVIPSLFIVLILCSWFGAIACDAAWAARFSCVFCWQLITYHRQRFRFLIFGHGATPW